MAEQGHGGIRTDEAVPAKWRQFPHRDAVAGHDERLAVVELPHYLAAFIAEFPLSDLSGHTTTVARSATLDNAYQRVVLQWPAQTRKRKRIGLRQVSLGTCLGFEVRFNFLRKRAQNPACWTPTFQHRSSDWLVEVYGNQDDRHSMAPS